MTVVGTRPELIRLSQVIPLLDRCCDHMLVWTGQNFDLRLSTLFFDELEIRKPDVSLAAPVGWDAGVQVAQIFERVSMQITNVEPDRFLVLGDTNSALSAFVAKRHGVPVFHMEAGNRCYDDRVPEEVNRRVIDTCSDVLMPYTQRSAQNLLAEGYPGRRIHVTGNPIWEVLQKNEGKRVASDALSRLGVEYGKFFLVTAHRAENVDDPERLHSIVSSLEQLREVYPDFKILVSVHPRTRERLKKHFAGAWQGSSEKTLEWRGITWLPPLGFHDFVRLEESAAVVLTDSGTVQEECCLLGTETVTLRDTTERPETIDCGSNILSGVTPARVVAAVKQWFDLAGETDWRSPEGYEVENVAAKVVRIVLGQIQ